MILEMAFVLCAPTVITNHTDTWTKDDERVYKFNQDKCELNYKESPCLKEFIKKEKDVYRIICSKRL